MTKEQRISLWRSLRTEKRALDDMIEEIDEWIILNPASLDVGRIRILRLRLESRRTLVKAEIESLRNKAGTIFKAPKADQVKRVKKLADKVEERVSGDLQVDAIINLATNVLKTVNEVRPPA